MQQWTRGWRAVAVALTLTLGAVPVASAQSESELDAGVRLFRAQRYADARVQLTAAHRANPGNGVAAFHLGRIALAEENSEEAVKWLERAHAADRRNASYHLWLGQAYGAQALRAGKLKQVSLAKKVQRAFEDAVHYDPSNVEARLALTRYYLVAPGFMGGSKDKAQAQAKEIAKLNPYQGRIAAAAIAEAKKDPATAERELHAALSQYPDSAPAYYVLAGTFQRTKQWDKSFDLYEALLLRRPDETNALYFIGRLGALSGQRLERSEAALRRFVALPPKEGSSSVASAYLRLGTIQAKRGEREAARASFTAGLKVDPKRNDLKEALGALR